MNSNCRALTFVSLVQPESGPTHTMNVGVATAVLVVKVLYWYTAG